MPDSRVAAEACTRLRKPNFFLYKVLSVQTQLLLHVPLTMVQNPDIALITV